MASMGERCAWIRPYEAIAAGELAPVRETDPRLTGSPATGLNAFGHRPVANREPRRALRSDDTEAPCVVASGPMSAGAGFILRHLLRF